MPNQAHSGVVGIQWHRCDRCGTDQRVSDLVRQQGFLVCKTYNCVDNTLVNKRPQLIQQVLDSGEPEPALANILIENLDDRLDEEL